MLKKPDFLLFLQFQGGLWEEIFLCCVSTALLLLLLGAARPVLDGWMFGFGVPAQPSFGGLPFGVAERAPGRVQLCCCLPWRACKGWEIPKTALPQGADPSGLLPHLVHRS